MLYMCRNVHTYAMEQKWRSEDNFRHQFSPSSVGQGEQTQFVRFGGKFLYCLSHLTEPPSLFLFIFQNTCIEETKHQKQRTK